MKKQPQTREEKIKFIKDMMQGKASPDDIIEPITGMVVTDNGKVFLHTDASGNTERFPDGVDLEEFKRERGIKLTTDRNPGMLIVEVCDFSKD